MNTYFGDLHNHCGITYGFGSLENAIKRAKKPARLLRLYRARHVAGYVMKRLQVRSS